MQSPQTNTPEPGLPSIDYAQSWLRGSSDHVQVLSQLMDIHVPRLLGDLRTRTAAHVDSLSAVYYNMGRTVGLPAKLLDYLIDAQQRTVLFMDTLRQRGNGYLAHAAAGCPPVLAYEYETIVDGRHLIRPVNYSLVRIVPPTGHLVRDNGRPYIIIDPRAGHGSGIGGFKSDSEVGVALADGHPVYFVIFRPEPEPHQTIADICAAEAEFVRTVIARHPGAPKPIIIGNCQGGWAAMILAATNPDITGPIVVNGSPLSYWAGTRGKNPLRYMGGLAGGALPALIASDFTGGKFDGANLVLNFESLNPGATWWRKYYDLYDKADTEGPRFLEFERWWSGFYFMNDVEIHWILENLFIGNKLPRGRARFDNGQAIDLRDICSPIIVFASAGDNITPPQQALNWIADIYSDVQQIKLRGQRILYTLHSAVGHLGIFVSAQVAKKEHREIGSTLKSIEALAPGLYELVITMKPENGSGPRYSVSFEERTIDDIVRLYDDGRDDEQPFKVVARLSELATELYDVTVRPWIRATSRSDTVQWLIAQHPLRQQRTVWSDANPWLRTAMPILANSTRSHRQPAAADNPFLMLERCHADLIEDSWNLYRNCRDAWYELAFHTIFCSPSLQGISEHSRLRRGINREEDIQHRADIVQLLSHIEHGGYAEAVIRMLVLMAQARGSVRRSRLERSYAMLHSREPFSSLTPEARARIIQEQSTLVSLEPERALTALKKLLPNDSDRQSALKLVMEIAGPEEEMNTPTLMMLTELTTILGLQAFDEPAQPPLAMPLSIEVAV